MEPRRESVVRVLGAHTPGLLTCAAQVFSSLNVAVEALRLERDGADRSIAIIEIEFIAEERTAELACRKLSRLIDVLDVIPVEGFASVETGDDTSTGFAVPHPGGAAVV